jgi:hypothetical protein
MSRMPFESAASIATFGLGLLALFSIPHKLVAESNRIDRIDKIKKKSSLHEC